jgi:hypothetical protein
MRELEGRSLLRHVCVPLVERIRLCKETLLIASSVGTDVGCGGGGS